MVLGTHELEDLGNLQGLGNGVQKRRAAPLALAQEEL